MKPAARSVRRTPPAAAGLVRELEIALSALGCTERAAGAKRYLKSELHFLGVAAPGIRSIARDLLHKHPNVKMARLRACTRALWKKPVFELRAVAVALLERTVDDLEPRDLRLLEAMLRNSRTWAFVDWIAIRLVGPLVERHPELLRDLDRWARDEDFWMRRSALLALLLPIRRGETGADSQWRRFLRYADAMLDEQEFFIRKAIGWVLREAAAKSPRRVAAYVRSRAPRMSGLTWREATRNLPAETRARLVLSTAARVSQTARREPYRHPPAGRSTIDRKSAK